MMFEMNKYYKHEKLGEIRAVTCILPNSSGDGSIIGLSKESNESSSHTTVNTICRPESELYQWKECDINGTMVNQIAEIYKYYHHISRSGLYLVVNMEASETELDDWYEISKEDFMKNTSANQ